MLVGAALGAKIQSFWLIFIFAIGLHFLFDRLPHWEYRFAKPDQKVELENISRKMLLIFSIKAMVDFAFGSLIIWLLWQNSFNLYPVLLGVSAALLPDIAVFLHVFTRAVLGLEIKMLKKFYLFHTKIHILKTKNPPLWGIAIESFVILLSIYLLWQ